MKNNWNGSTTGSNLVQTSSTRRMWCWKITIQDMNYSCSLLTLFTLAATSLVAASMPVPKYSSMGTVLYHWFQGAGHLQYQERMVGIQKFQHQARFLTLFITRGKQQTIYFENGSAEDKTQSSYQNTWEDRMSKWVTRRNW